MPPPSSTSRSPVSARVGCSRGRPVMRAMAAPDAQVLRVVVVLGPAVERPVHQHHAARCVHHAGRGRVAQPDPVGRHHVQAHAVGVHAVGVQRVLRARAHRVVVAQHLHGLVRGDHAHDLRIDPRNGAQLAGPVGFVMRPAEPGGAVRRPLGRHPPLPASPAEVPVQDRPVGVHAPIAEERPVAPDGFDQRRVARGGQDRLVLDPPRPRSGRTGPR